MSRDSSETLVLSTQLSSTTMPILVSKACVNSHFITAVTLDELRRAIENMGLTQTVSAELLYRAILQVQSPPRHTPEPQITPDQRKSNSRFYLPIFNNVPVTFRGQGTF